jgi:hypothetical protein
MSASACSASGAKKESISSGETAAVLHRWVRE